MREEEESDFEEEDGEEGEEQEEKQLNEETWSVFFFVDGEGKGECDEVEDDDVEEEGG